MTAAPDVDPVEPGRVPFADASPARVREALTAEDRAAFDQQWRVLMARATERLDLSEVHEALRGWRQVAWVTSAHGPEVYRRTLASAQRRLQSGDRAPGALPWACRSDSRRARLLSYSIDIDLAAQDAIAALPVDALLAVAEVFAAPIGDLKNIPDVRLGRSSAGPQPVDHPYR